MDLINHESSITGGASSSSSSRASFLTHVFSTREEDKAEILNVVQYAIIAIIPVVILNKLIQRFIPEADGYKSSLELLAEVFIQIVVIFTGVIAIHRCITYLPTYSGFKYEHLTLTNVVLTFLVIILSVQTKLGIKVNMLVDRVYDLWNGNSAADGNGSENKSRQSLRVHHGGGGGGGGGHSISQSDYLDNSQSQTTLFPPAPVATTRSPSGGGHDSGMSAASSGGGGDFMSNSLLAANSVLGGSFGSFF